MLLTFSSCGVVLHSELLPPNPPPHEADEARKGKGMKSWSLNFGQGLLAAPIDSAPSANYSLLPLLWSGQMTKWGETQK